MIKNLGNSSSSGGGGQSTNASLTGDGSSGTPLAINTANGNNFSAAQTVTRAPAANAEIDGLILQDTTDASSTNQQLSPRVRWVGKGWKTTATAASQFVEWRAELIPVQGATNPSTTWNLGYQINGVGDGTGTYTDQFTVGSGITGGMNFLGTGVATFNGSVLAPVLRVNGTSLNAPSGTGLYAPVTGTSPTTLGVCIASSSVALWTSSLLQVAGSVSADTAGSGFLVKEGSNCKQGTSTLVGGTVVVTNSSVTANSRIFITAQSLGTVAVPSAYGVSARTAGTSFTILASAPTDTSVVAWEIFEPAA